MAWRAKGEPLSGVGSNVVQRLVHDGGQTAEIRANSPAIVAQLVDLIERGHQDLERSTRALSVGSIGYWVVFSLGGGEYGSTHVTVPAPGFQHGGHLLQLQRDLAQHFGRPVVVMNWTALDAPPQIELAQLVPPNLVKAT